MKNGIRSGSEHETHAVAPMCADDDEVGTKLFRQFPNFDSRLAYDHVHRLGVNAILFCVF